MTGWQVRHRVRLRCAVIVWLASLLASTASVAVAQSPAAPAASAGAAPSAFRIHPVDDAWRAALPRDPVLATQAYLDRLPADVVARSNAYHEGQHWLLLWNWLAGIAVAALLLTTRLAASIRDRLQARLRRPLARDAAFGGLWMVASWVLTLPLTIWQGFFREHAYGMSTQGFGAWCGEQIVSLAVATVAATLLVAVLYAVLRRTGDRWWLWGAGVTMGFAVFASLIAPIWIDPLFNTYKPVEPGPVRDAVLAMARANGVPADDVYVFDASRQTTRVSANVSGLFGSAAIRLNDNLLRRSSDAEIRAVMGHEIGHYAMNHIPRGLLFTAIVVLIVFAASKSAMQALLARWGERWQLRGVADVASLPLLAAVVSTGVLLATPVFNLESRTREVEADLWGLNVSREPHGEAEVLLKLVEYRKPDPGPIEEALFFTHPSTRTRIYNAMRWREQLLGEDDRPR